MNRNKSRSSEYKIISEFHLIVFCLGNSCWIQIHFWFLHHNNLPLKQPLTYSRVLGWGTGLERQETSEKLRLTWVYYILFWLNLLSCIIWFWSIFFRQLNSEHFSYISSAQTPQHLFWVCEHFFSFYFSNNFPSPHFPMSTFFQLFLYNIHL